MSGHSKWATTRRQKEIVDKKRGNVFTKIARNITVAARDGGGDLETNFKLRIAVDQGKAANMPKDNIDRAIKKGTGELKGEAIEEVIYEGVGPDNTFFVIQSLTDNKNRTVAEIRHIFSKAGGALGSQNSVMWQFDKKGVIRIADYKTKITDKDEFELNLIDWGADDVADEEGDLIVYTKVENFQKVREALEKNNIACEFAEIEYLPKEYKKIESEKSKEQLQKLFDTLDENDDVNNFYTNISIE